METKGVSMKTLEELQEEVGATIAELQHSKDPHIILLYLMEELGEATRAFLKENGYKAQNNRVTETFQQEIGDVFFMILRLAYVTNTDLEKQLRYTLEKLHKAAGNI